MTSHQKCCSIHKPASFRLWCAPSMHIFRRWEFRQTEPEHVYSQHGCTVTRMSLQRSLLSSWCQAKYDFTHNFSETAFNKIRRYPSRNTCPGIKACTLLSKFLCTDLSHLLFYFSPVHIFFSTVRNQSFSENNNPDATALLEYCNTFRDTLFFILTTRPVMLFFALSAELKHQSAHCEEWALSINPLKLLIEGFSAASNSFRLH